MGQAPELQATPASSVTSALSHSSPLGLTIPQLSQVLNQSQLPLLVYFLILTEHSKQPNLRRVTGKAQGVKTRAGL